MMRASLAVLCRNWGGRKKCTKSFENVSENIFLDRFVRFQNIDYIKTKKHIKTLLYEEYVVSVPKPTLSEKNDCVTAAYQT